MENLPDNFPPDLSTTENMNTSKNPDSNLVLLTFFIYGLHAFSAVGGVLTSAFVVTAFLTGWPSILAVILNYIKRNEVADTYLASHFEWQIRTFWLSAIWLLVVIVMFVTVFLIPLAWIIIVVVGIWVLYRIIAGMLGLIDGRAMPMD